MEKIKTSHAVQFFIPKINFIKIKVLNIKENTNEYLISELEKSFEQRKSNRRNHKRK